MRAMKDSGVEWIGEIPAEWETIKVKNVSTLNPFCYRKFNSMDQVSYLPMECLKNGYMTPKIIEFCKMNSGLTFFENNDLVLAKVTPCFENGNIAVASNLKSNAGFGSSELFIFRCFNINLRFLFYSFQCETLKNKCVSTMTGVGGLKRISPEFIRNCKVPFSKSLCQKHIADFLDRKCAQIEAIIAKQRQIIEKLKEYKQSIITEAVTKGLDPNVPMKDSGIAWIGKIPEHWKVGQLKYFADIRSGVTLGKKYSIGTKLYEYPYLRVANVQVDHTDLSNIATIQVSLEDANKYRLYAKELLMTEGGDRDKLGRGCVWNSEIPHCLHQNHIFAVSCNAKNLDVYFLDYVTTSDVARNYFDCTAKKTTNLASTNSTIILQFRLPIPPIKEQKEIMNSLNEKCKKVNSMLNQKQLLIDKLTQYKKSLIYEAVTGKMEV